MSRASPLTRPCIQSADSEITAVLTTEIHEWTRKLAARVIELVTVYWSSLWRLLPNWCPLTQIALDELILAALKTEEQVAEEMHKAVRQGLGNASG